MWKYSVIYKTGKTQRISLSSESDRATATGNMCAENFVKFGRVVFEICERTDRQAHRETGSSQYFAPHQLRSNIRMIDRRRYWMDDVKIFILWHWTDYKIMQFACVWVSEWFSQSVFLSHKTSWTLYSSQSSIDLHQTCHHGRVSGDVITDHLLFLVEIRNTYVRQTGSGANFYHCSYGKIGKWWEIRCLTLTTIWNVEPC